MKPASSLSNCEALVSSLDVEKAGPTAPDVATSCMTSPARLPAAVSKPSLILSGSVEFFAMMWPPADSISALNHTVSDSARRPWALTSLCWSCAALTSWSQVTGFVMSSPAASATDFRYQSSWVLAQNGTATSLPFHLADARDPGTTPSLTWDATSLGTGARKPAWASSGANTTSRLIRSIESSAAARRRTSCSRWASELRGRTETSRLYAPLEAALQAAAIFACPPLSGLMYQVSVGVPPAFPPPQAARVPVATSAAAAPAIPRRNRRDLRGRSPGPAARRVSRPDVFGTVIASVGVRCEHMVIAVRSVVQITDGCQFEASRATDRDQAETSGRSPAGQSSPTRPAITDGVVTSLGVRGSTVVK